MIIRLCLIVITLSHPAWVRGQIVIRGTVVDSATAEALPVANIQIDGTLKGTITNRDGRFQLPIASFPSTLIVRYIGYETARITFDRPPLNDVTLRLRPLSIQMREVVITGEDPAIAIMREVIRRKKIWQQKLHTYQADAYSRLNLSNDTMVGAVAEQLSSVYWKRDEGLREIIKSKKHTANVENSMTFSLGGENNSLLNFYDGDVQIQGSRFVGPTHEKAFDYYTFRLTGERRVGEQLIYEIEVHPRSRLQPVFEGRLHVLDDSMAMIDVDLRPADHVVYPLPIQKWDVAYRQQFSNFGREFWLPVGMHVDGQIKIAMPGLEFPNIHYDLLAGFSNYAVNVDAPDTLFQSKRRVRIDSTSLNDSTLFERTAEKIPLSQNELAAYDSLKKSDKIERIFKPRGFLARFADEEDGEDDTTGTRITIGNVIKGVSPRLHYNRVEGAHLGLKISRSIGKKIDAGVWGGWMTGLDKSFVGANVKWSLSKRLSLGLEGRDEVRPRMESDAYDLFVASWNPLFGYRDYFDYFRFQGGALSIGYRLPAIDTKFRLAWNVERHRSVEKQTDADLLARSYVQRTNPAIDAGRLQSVTFQASYGEKHLPAAPTWQNGATLDIEHALPSLPNSDFDFTRIEAAVNVRIPTFLRRRFLPNVLDVRAVAGTYRGKLPLQRWNMLDGALGTYTPTATFRTLRMRGYEGQKYAAVFWEHHFRSVPFELIGWDAAARKGYGFIVFGGHGRTWIKKTDLASLPFPPTYQNRFHHELGLSLNGVLGLFRIDGAWRLDRPGFWIGFSVAKIF